MKSSIPQQIYTDLKYIYDNQLIAGECFKPISNNAKFEQLEFFGDSYLNYRVSKIAIQKTTFDPCLLTEFRSASTSNATLTEFYEMVGLGSLPNVEHLDEKKKFKADTVEALIGELHAEKSSHFRVKKLLNDIISHLLLIGEIKFNNKYYKTLLAPSNTTLVNHITSNEQQKQISSSPPKNQKYVIEPQKQTVKVTQQPQMQQSQSQPKHIIKVSQQTQVESQPIKILQKPKVVTTIVEPQPQPQPQVQKQTIIDIVPSSSSKLHKSVNINNNNQSNENILISKKTILENTSTIPTPQQEILLSPFSINNYDGHFF